MLLKNKPFIIGLILSPLLYGFFWLLFNKPEPKTMIETLKPAPSFNIIPTNPRVPISKKPFQLVSEDETTKDVSIDDFAGRPTLLHFWATWCKPCVSELPELDEYAGQHGNQMNIVVIVSDLKAKKDEIIKFYKDKGFSHIKIYMDENKDFLREIGIKALPTTIFVTSDGLEIGRALGTIDWLSTDGEAIHKSLCG